MEGRVLRSLEQSASALETRHARGEAVDHKALRKIIHRLDRLASLAEAGDLGGAKRSLEGCAPRLVSDVWRGVAAYCSVETLLTLETTGKDLNELLRAKSMDAIWRHRFGMAAPSLATVLVVDVEVAGRDLCRLYESRWRAVSRVLSTWRGFKETVIGVNYWHALPSMDLLNPPKVILTVDDVACELEWDGLNGYGQVENHAALTWVPAENAASRLYRQDEISDVVTSCFVVGDEKIVELWRGFCERVDMDEDDSGNLFTYQQGSVDIIGFGGEETPQHKLTLYAADHEALYQYNRSRHRLEARNERIDLVSMICYLRFSPIDSDDSDVDENLNDSYSAERRYRLFDAHISIDVHEFDSFRDLPTLASLLNCLLSPGQGSDPHTSSALEARYF